MGKLYPRGKAGRASLRINWRIESREMAGRVCRYMRETLLFLQQMHGRRNDECPYNKNPSIYRTTIYLLFTKTQFRADHAPTITSTEAIHYIRRHVYYAHYLLFKNITLDSAHH